jgi:hypothetical protein
MVEKSEIEIKFRSEVERLFVEAVGGDSFAEMIKTERHKVYVKGSLVSSNILHILSESQN